MSARIFFNIKGKREVASRIHPKMNVAVVAAIISNILSVVGIVICIKYLTEIDDYNFMVFLSFMHFAFTSFGTRVMLMMKAYSYAPASMGAVMPVALVSNRKLLDSHVQRFDFIADLRGVCCQWRS